MKKLLIFLAVIHSVGQFSIAQNRVRETELRLGVTFIEEDKVDDSYRLYSSRNLTTAHMISPEGKYLHSWYYPHLEDTVTSNFGGFGMTWHYAEMLPNGNLVAIVKDEMLIEIDWNSNLVWKAKLRAHHDFARGDQGNTIVVSRRDRPDPWRTGETIAFDELIEYDKEGNVIWTWYYEEHMDDLQELIGEVPHPVSKQKDFPHVNTVEILPDNPVYKKDRRFKPGNLLICGAHANLIMLIDKESKDIVWAWGHGIIEGPHMPTMLPDGNILMYDNGNQRGYTKAVEINPLSGEIVWEYGHPGGFFSPARGSALRMDRANTLIATSDFGWFFEVSPEGEKVWEYYNPDLVSNGNRMGLYRTLPYNKELVEVLLQENKGRYYERPGKEKYQEKHGLSGHLMKVVSWIEQGELDKAYRWLNYNGIAVINERETHFAYSLLFSARGNTKRSVERMKKAIAAGMPPEIFSSGFSDLFSPLIISLNK